MCVKGCSSVSNTPLDLDPHVQRLVKEGFHIESLPAHLIIHDVPYVDAQGDVCEGKFIIPITTSGNRIQLQDHQIDFMGNFPYKANGVSLESLLNKNATNNEIEHGIVSNFKFSNHPVDDMLKNCYDKVKHYEAIICSEAQLINPDATARLFKPLRSHSDNVFRYADTNTARAGIYEQANRLRGQKIAIIGLGGTGSYILDLVSKTPVKEIRIFDGDFFENHNAFRAPGAAKMSELKLQMKKVDYFTKRYRPMRCGIVGHGEYIDSSNVDLLSKCDFVFVCIDSGESRKLITTFLKEHEIAFIDCGIDLTNRPVDNRLEASSRTTLVTTLTANDAFPGLSFGDTKDDLYGSNIQIAEVNAQNAATAVIEWKKFAGFYANDLPRSFQVVYDSQDSRMTRQ